MRFQRIKVHAFHICTRKLERLEVSLFDDPKPTRNLDVHEVDIHGNNMHVLCYVEGCWFRVGS